MPGLVGQVDGEGARRGHGGEHRNAGHPGLLRQLEAGPAGDHQHVPGERQPALRTAQPITLSTALCRPTSSRRHDQLAVGGEQAGGVQPPVRSKPAAPRAAGPERGEDRRRDGHRVVGHVEARTGPYRVDAGLAADAARAGGVEVPRRVGRRRRHAGASATSTTLYVFGRRRRRRTVVRSRTSSARPDDALGEQEAERQVEVVPGGPHRDGQRRPSAPRADPDLQRLLGRQRVGPADRFTGRVASSRHTRRRSVARPIVRAYERPGRPTGYGQAVAHPAPRRPVGDARGRRTRRSCWPAGRRAGWVGRPSRPCRWPAGRCWTGCWPRSPTPARVSWSAGAGRAGRGPASPGNSRRAEGRWRRPPPGSSWCRRTSGASRCWPRTCRC